MRSMEFSRPEYWSGFPSLGDILSPGIEPRSPALQADSLPTEPHREGNKIRGPVFSMSHRQKYGQTFNQPPCLCSYLGMLSSVHFSSVTQSCQTLCDPMNHSTPGLPVHHQLPEFTQTHAYRVGDAIQPCHPLSSPCPPNPNPSQHQGLFQWVNSSHEVAKVLEFQLQH